jgi:protein HokB
MQGVKGMTPFKYLLGILLIICLTILIFSLINRGSLCELTIRNGHQEVAAKLACHKG